MLLLLLFLTLFKVQLSANELEKICRSAQQKAVAQMVLFILIKTLCRCYIDGLCSCWQVRPREGDGIKCGICKAVFSPSNINDKPCADTTTTVVILKSSCRTHCLSAALSHGGGDGDEAFLPSLPAPQGPATGTPLRPPAVPTPACQPCHSWLPYI